MTRQKDSRLERACVIGCGGVLGIAWSVGLITGLARAGVRLEDTGLWIGASAGSVVAARLASQTSVESLFAEQTNGSVASEEIFRPYSQSAVDAKNQLLFDKVRGDLTQARQRIGAWALRSNTPPLEQRRAIIAHRLKNADWPETPLRIVTVNAHTGAEKIWDRHCAIELIDAVTASCAVPGTWPSVALQGDYYMDGGLRSMTNADLAMGAKRVLVISPLGYSDANPVSGHLRAELAQLQTQGAKVLVLAPDAASLAAIGLNILDPGKSTAVALAGLQQGQQWAAQVSAFWNPSSDQPSTAFANI